MCICYLDNIIDFSETFDDNLCQLRSVLERFGLKLNRRKCIRCHGNQDPRPSGVARMFKKVKSITNLHSTNNVNNVKRFLGYCPYRHFMKDFSQEKRSLQKLLQGETKFIWSAEQQEAFDTLQRALTRTVRPTCPDRIRLHNDAHGCRLGAIVVQVFDSKKKV